jgi:hypothetical protein
MSINRNRLDSCGNTKLHLLVQEDDYASLKSIFKEFKLKYSSSLTQRAVYTSLRSLVNIKNSECKAGGRVPLHVSKSTCTS